MSQQQTEQSVSPATPSSVSPSRKVSINVVHETPQSQHGYDNPAFEQSRSRKVSQTSEHAEIGPVRKKSILHNSHNAYSSDNNTLSDYQSRHDGTFLFIILFYIKF